MMARTPEDPGELELLLRRAWEAGRRRWPQVDLPAEVFARHVARLLPRGSPEKPFASIIEGLDIEGLYLACACVNGVPMAVETLEEHYLARLPALLGQLRLSATALDEVCQSLRTHLLVRTPEGEPRLARYAGGGALLIWMRVIAARMVLKQRASGRETPAGNMLTALADSPAVGPDAELELIRRRYRHEFRDALRDAFASLSSEQRYLLRLHFIDRLPTTKIAPLYGMDQSTISRRLRDAREQVYEETRRQLQERLRLSSREFTSLTEAIKSRFDMSLSQFLNDDNEEDEDEG